ncbi:PilN domain-containing protein [Massilia sp. IC2-477]|uniref:PilN domain-containing protein n=1 Tax=unclassified Massilia TaxID=2609279 RepID=UPI001D12B37B|nr:MULTISPECIES: PilN domain-containing protein [unclassified Massilia]MCC2957883.1 PilN domain-containing protein [Massilia sp. IC2-477]MCC2974064.1 PilN domain-containing protein [Massilia sp. IC2-476]
MIRINLLPHREAKRKQKQAAFVAMLAAGGVAGAAVVLLVGAWNASRIAVQNERNLVLKTASAELDKKIGEIKTLKEEIEALKARQQAVEDLQGDRNQPVYLLDELVRQTPEGVYLKSFRQEGQKVTLNGYAQSQERVAELLRNVSGTSPWLERPNLTEVKVSSLDKDKSKNGRKVVEFQMDVAIKRLREQEDTGSGDGAKGAKPAAASERKLAKSAE